MGIETDFERTMNLKSINHPTNDYTVPIYLLINGRNNEECDTFAITEDKKVQIAKTHLLYVVLLSVDFVTGCRDNVLLLWLMCCHIISLIIGHLTIWLQTWLSLHRNQSDSISHSSRYNLKWIYDLLELCEKLHGCPKHTYINRLDDRY